MFTHSTFAGVFPAHCRRCGGMLNEPVSFCIHCGIAHPLDADFEPSIEPTTTQSATSTPSTPAASPADRSGHIAPFIFQAPKLFVPETNVAPLFRRPLALSIRHQTAHTKGAALCVFSILAFGVLWLWTDHRSNFVTRDAGATRVAVGAVGLNSTGQLVGAMDDATWARKTDTSQPATFRSNSVVARRFIGTLAAARLGLSDHDLSGARAALDAALTTHPDNADAQRLERDLTSLESRRDAALRTARSCVKAGKWDCVRVGANDALEIDVGSTEAQTLLQRAIVASGWMPIAPEVRAAREIHAALAPHADTRRRIETPQPATGFASRGGRADGIGGGNGEERDPRVRAIVESGWKHPRSNGASASSGGDVAGH